MDIQHSPAGKVIKTLAGYRAFIPNPLPPQLDWNNSLVNALSRADHLIGKLAREANHLLSNPYLLTRPFIVCEAVLSSKIEGTQSTIREILLDEAGGHEGHDQADLEEVKNYIVALDYGLKRLKNFPLSLRLIKEIHAKLMRGVRGQHATPGEFRRTQNWIGLPGSTLATAKYIPPTPDELMDCLSAFELFLHDRQLPSLIHICLCHYQFEAIHPFLDGNGRIGRLLITLLLVERQILTAPLLYLSAFFEATRNEYYRQLYNVSAYGNWNDWLIYCLNGIAIQSTDALSRAERINKLISDWKMQVKSASSKVPVDIVQYFAVNPFLTIKKVAKDLNIAVTTAQRAIQKLESLDIIVETTSGKRNRIYCVKKILDILEEPVKLN